MSIPRRKGIPFLPRCFVTMMTCLVLLLLLTLIQFSWAAQSRRQRQQRKNKALSEDERVAGYYQRNYTWPIDTFVPNTDGWNGLMKSRLEQVMQMPDRNERYEGFVQTLRSALLVPNFTEHGFGLAKCPTPLLQALQQGIHDGLANHQQRLEGRPLVMGGPPAWFISRPDLTQRALHELEHYAETWANMSLTPHYAYGFRLYRNESALYMHVDRMETHIISFILHIDSSDDAEPWPIFIEDYLGQTHEVILTPGDMLFYESSKCWHGRPQKFNGSWYTSLFVHYYPTDGWQDRDHKMEAHYAVPPNWNGDLSTTTTNDNNPEQQQSVPRLEMRGTGITEPECPNEWCRSTESIKWGGPAEEGVWLAPNGEKYHFHPKQVEYNDEM